MYYRFRQRITESWSQVLFFCDCCFFRRSFNPFSALSAEESCWIRLNGCLLSCLTKSIAIKVQVAVFVAHCCSFWTLCALMAHVLYKTTVTFNQSAVHLHRPELDLASWPNDCHLVIQMTVKSLLQWPQHPLFHLTFLSGCNAANSVLLFCVNRLPTDSFPPLLFLIVHACSVIRSLMLGFIGNPVKQ